MAIFVQESSTANVILTIIFFLEVVGTFATTLMPGFLPPGCPLAPREAAATLLATCVALFPVIFLIKRLGGVLGAFFSRTILRHLGNPLGKMRNRRKFEDQFWQLCIHVGMTALEVYVLYYDDGGEPWMDDYTTLWRPHPRFQKHAKLSLHVLYLVQMAVWVVTCVSHRFFEERHKDYVMMFVHHLVTIALVWLSYSYNYVRIGTLVLLLHDSSDVVIDLLKLANYLKLEGLRGGFLVELFFLTNFVTWAYTRLYVYPRQVMWLGGWLGPRESCTAPGQPGMEAFSKAVGSEFTRGHVPGFKLGDGSFDLLTNIRELPTHPNLDLYWILNPLLSCLFVMHIIWYLMFWRLLYRLITQPESAHEAGAEEYEGESDKED